MKMISKKEDKINKRVVYTFEVEHIKDKTPDRKTILESAMKETRIDKKLMIIKNIKTIYGQNKALVIIHAYSKKEDLEKNEPKHLIKRVTFKEDETAKSEEVKE
jgi:small subunit ribosomal protein S24e